MDMTTTCDSKSISELIWGPGAEDHLNSVYKIQCVYKDLGHVKAYKG